MKKQTIQWRRLAWVAFVYIYCGLFFYNFFSPYPNWPFTYIYTMLFIIWLGVEYYEKRLFFQSGFVPINLLSIPLRILYALFFYSSFIIGISTVVWWSSIQIDFYPFLSIIGIGLLIGSIIVRRKVFSAQKISQDLFQRFYISIGLLILSLAFGYSSWFLLVYGVVIGVPLVLLQKANEQRQFSHLEAYVSKISGAGSVTGKDCATLWQKYLDRGSKKRGKK